MELHCLNTPFCDCTCFDRMCGHMEVLIGTRSRGVRPALADPAQHSIAIIFESTGGLTANKMQAQESLCPRTLTHCSKDLNHILLVIYLRLVPGRRSCRMVLPMLTPAAERPSGRRLERGLNPAGPISSKIFITLLKFSRFYTLES